MKTLLLKTLACVAVVLPFSKVQAKTFGSFTPNKTFVLTVQEKESFKQKPGPSTRKVSIGQIFVIDNIVEAGSLDFTVITVKGANVSVGRVIYGLTK
jgi:hypothetical protein